jgi:hypothetical protein
MPGFMSGFGDAFSKTFAQARQNSAEAKRDKIRQQYQKDLVDYEKNIKEKQQDAANERRMKGLADVYLPNQQGAWQYLYDNFRDLDDGHLKEILENNTITVSKGVAAPSGPSSKADAEGATDMTKSAQTSVNTQMVEAGMPTQDKGGLFDNDTWGAKAKGKRESEFTQRLATVKAESANDIKETAVEGHESPLSSNPDYKVTIKPKTNNTFEKYGAPKNLMEASHAKARAAASGDRIAMRIADEAYDRAYAIEKLESSLRKNENGVTEPPMAAIMNPDGTFSGKFAKNKIDGQWVDDDGNPVQDVKEYDSGAQKETEEILKNSDKEVDEYNGKAISYADTARTVSSAAQLVYSDPSVMTWTGTLSETFSDLNKNIQDLKKLFDSSVDSLPDNYMEETLKLEDKLTDALGAGVMDAMDQKAINKKLFEVYATKIAYADLAQKGQTGTGVNKQEFEIAKKEAMGNGNVIAWKQNMDFILQNGKDNLKLKAATINNSGRMRLFENNRGYKNPVQPAEDIDAILSRDGKYLDADKKYKSLDFNRPQPINPQQTPAQAQPGQSNTGNYTPTGRVDSRGVPIYLDENGNEGTLE